MEKHHTSLCLFKHKQASLAHPPFQYVAEMIIKRHVMHLSSKGDVMLHRTDTPKHKKHQNPITPIIL